MADRVASRTGEDQSWICSPVSGVAAELVTVPATVTVPLGAATAGFSEVIAMVALADGASRRAAVPAAASAGAAAATTQPTASADASSRTPARRHTGRAEPGQC